MTLGFPNTDPSFDLTVTLFLTLTVTISSNKIIINLKPKSYLQQFGLWGHY